MLLNNQQQNLHIRSLVKACDRESYLSALFGNPAHAHALWTVYAFNCELAKISRQVREPMLGKIRLQWWHDVVEQAGRQQENLSGHPVADQLTQVIGEYGLDSALFHKIIDAREEEFGEHYLRDSQSFTLYQEAIWGNLYRIAWQVSSFSPTDDKENQAMDEELFNCAGNITAMIKFISLAHPTVIAAHMALVLDQPVQLPVEGGQGSVLKFGTQMKAYKEIQVTGLEKKMAFVAGVVSKTPKPCQDIFLPLALGAKYIKQWQQNDDTDHTMFLRLNPLSQFFTLWRASYKGLGHYLKKV